MRKIYQNIFDLEEYISNIFYDYTLTKMICHLSNIIIFEIYFDITDLYLFFDVIMNYIEFLKCEKCLD